MKGHRMHNLNKKLRCLAVLLAAVLFLCVPAHAAESIVGGVRMELIRSSKQKTETQKALQYVTEIGFTKRSLLTEDMTYSLVWLIPGSFLPGLSPENAER